MKISSAAACLLLLTACGSSRAPQAAAPATGTSPKQVIATFVGQVDPASGTMTLRTTPTTTGRTSLRSSLATSRKSLVVPESSGISETVTVQNADTPIVDPNGCGVGVNSFHGTVQLATNFSTTVLQNVYAEILTISSAGHEACNSVTPPLGDSAGAVSATNGLWQYGTLYLPGVPSQVAEWNFRLPDLTGFTFTGRIVATLQDTFSVGSALVGIAYDAGTDTIWVTDAGAGILPGSVMKLSAATGAVLGTPHPVGINPVAVTADGAGGIWVANWTDNTVTKLTAATGAVVATYNVGVGLAPIAVTADGAGGIWVANSGDGTVTKLNAADGTPSTGSPFTGFGTGFVEPYAVAFVSSTNSVWVVDASAETVTQLSATNGAVMGVPHPVGHFPQAVTADGSGGIWVANNLDATVTRLTAAGAFVATYSAGLGPVGIASDGSGSIWVADKDIPVIRLSATNGSVLAQYDVSASQSSIVAPAGIAWIANGDGTVIRLTP